MYQGRWPLFDRLETPSGRRNCCRRHFPECSGPRTTGNRPGPWPELPLLTARVTPALLVVEEGEEWAGDRKDLAPAVVVKPKRDCRMNRKIGHRAPVERHSYHRSC